MPTHQKPDVRNVEDDGNGFFITGINTGEDKPEPNQPLQPQFEQIVEEEEQFNHYDPADSYKHVAVVDCSKAFSNQEVSNTYVFIILFLYSVF